MTPEFDPMDRFAENPFYVLGVSITASRQEIEREGLKLLGMLELGLSAAKTYETPVGPMERTAERVREALAELRVPERRLMHELWATEGVPMGLLDGWIENSPPAEPQPEPWTNARKALGFER